MALDGNNVLLMTGASSDIGCTFLEGLEKQCCASEKGWIVIAQYRTLNQRLKDAMTEASHLDIRCFSADLSLRGGVLPLIKFTQEQVGAPTHILHLAAMPLEYTRLKSFDAERTSQELEIQVVSLAEIMKIFLPNMAKKRFGKVVSIASSCTLGLPPKFMSGYVLTKYALLGLMKSAAVEYSDKGLNINCISPAMINTKFLNHIDNRIVEMAAESSPLRRCIKTDEVAAAIDYLFSDAAACINGINLNLSGGEYM